jgi:hypothetical protein
MNKRQPRITNRFGVHNKMSEQRKVLEETTVAKIKALVKASPVLGTWKSEDGQLFFYAIGAQI